MLSPLFISLSLYFNPCMIFSEHHKFHKFKPRKILPLTPLVTAGWLADWFTLPDRHSGGHTFHWAIIPEIRHQALNIPKEWRNKKTTQHVDAAVWHATCMPASMIPTGHPPWKIKKDTCWYECVWNVWWPGHFFFDTHTLTYTYIHILYFCVCFYTSHVTRRRTWIDAFMAYVSVDHSHPISPPTLKRNYQPMLHKITRNYTCICMQAK